MFCLPRPLFIQIRMFSTKLPYSLVYFPKVIESLLFALRLQFVI